jgi:hypothetical protein
MILLKSVQWSAVVPADGRTERHDELTVAFRNFCERLRIECVTFVTLYYLHDQSSALHEVAFVTPYSFHDQSCAFHENNRNSI